MAKKIKKFNTPEDVVKALTNANCCREVIPEYSVDYWIDQYIWRVGVDDEMAEEAKEYIVYALAFILNELKVIPKDNFAKYFLDPDDFLDEVIEYGKKRGWYLDKHSAIGLCTYIIDDYIYETGELQYNSAASESVLEQIIANYPDKVITDICDPVWERYYNDLIYEHCEDEDAVHQYHDVHALEKAVRLRECVPSGYMRM